MSGVSYKVTASFWGKFTKSITTGLSFGEPRVSVVSYTEGNTASVSVNVDTSANYSLADIVDLDVSGIVQTAITNCDCYEAYTSNWSTLMGNTMSITCSNTVWLSNGETLEWDEENTSFGPACFNLGE